MGKQLELNAVNLKNILWEILNEVRAGDIDVAKADAIASQSREIARVIKSQQGIIRQANEQITAELIEYATGTDKQNK